MRFTVFGFLLLAMVFLSGCNKDSKVFGTASYDDGTPLPCGMLTIADAQHQYTGEIRGGKFEMGGTSPKSGMPPGNYKVFVSNCYDASGKNLVKDNYTKMDTTPLTLEVVKGKNPELDLKFSKP